MSVAGLGERFGTRAAVSLAAGIGDRLAVVSDPRVAAAFSSRVGDVGAGISPVLGSLLLSSFRRLRAGATPVPVVDFGGDGAM